ncbi:MAG: hypothetical protein AB7E96_10950 [Deferribacterales bacterium]
MDGLHEATGSLAVWLMIAVSVLGLALFKFKYVRNRVNVKRQQIHTFHKYAALALSPVLILHILTTDNTNVMLYTGAFLVFAVLFTGLLFRVRDIKSKFFNKLVYVKVAVLVVSLVFLTVGHDTAEKNRHNIIKTLQD